MDASNIPLLYTVLPEPAANFIRNVLASTRDEVVDELDVLPRGWEDQVEVLLARGEYVVGAVERSVDYLNVLHTRASTEVGTLTLDGLSFVSFEDSEILPIPAGATLRFHFDEPAPDGSVTFKLAPGDVDIQPIQAGPERVLTYALQSPTSGKMVKTADGLMMSFTATISATPSDGKALSYSLTFTTETAQATSSAGDASVQITGLRLVEGVWYAQLVSATTNAASAYPKPGAAVYTVLSGQFDQIPAF